jgi:DNA primase
MEKRPSGPSSGGDGKSSVLQATDIVELVGRSVALKRRGKDFVGLCPFHQEKTPSFHVSPSKQFYYCYGCKKGGNAIDFVMARDRVEFKEALRLLAEAAGIELPAFSGQQNSGERQTLLEANYAACLFFEKLIAHPQYGLAAREYLQERGFDEASIKRFRIGLAVDQWDALLNHPGMKKFSPRHLALAGLAKPRERGDGYYDTFRNRLMFPIRDENGRVIAFGGRVMPGSDDPAKYLNSPETPLFSKSRCVFGLDLARAKIVETRTVAVVEGYTDVMMAHQFGVSNVVSVLGTALTEQHVGMLRRLADRIVLIFDADAAGEAAVNRAVELFLTQPVEIAIASLPDGVDPDEFLLKHGAEEFNKLVGSAADALAYKWKQLEKQVKSSDAITDRQQAVEQYLATLAEARGSGPVDSIRWGAALARVSRLTEIPVEELSRRFKGGGTKYGARQGMGAAQAAMGSEPKNSAPPPIPTARQMAEGIILGLLLLEPEYWDRVQKLVPNQFSDPGLKKLAELVWKRQEDEGVVVLSEFLAGVEDEELKQTAVRWANEASNMPDGPGLLDGCLGCLAEEDERKVGRELVARLRRTGIESAGEPVDLSADLQALRELQEKARARQGVPIV